MSASVVWCGAMRIAREVRSIVGIVPNALALGVVQFRANSFAIHCLHNN